MFKKSDYYILSAAIISLILSIALWFTGNKDTGLFVGLWVPSIIGLGIYLKVISGGNNHG
jgi:hypothetical protein